MAQYTRRRMISTIGLGLATPFVSRISLAQPKPDRIIVGSYGGVFDRGMQHFSDDFTKRTGVKVNLVVGSAVQWISQLTANVNKPPLDVMISPVPAMLESGRKGLFDPPTVEKASNLADIPDIFVKMTEGQGVVWDYGISGLAYHKDRIKKRPDSFKAFIEGTIRGDYRAALISIASPSVHGLVIWNLNDVLGGTIDDISPAIDAIKRMKKNTVFYKSFPDFLTQLETGEADIGIFPDGRAWAHFDDGATWIDFYNPVEGGIFGAQVALKPKNAHPIAWEYINSMLAPEPQSKFSDTLSGYSMSNSKVVYSPRSKPRVTPWQQSRIPPNEEISRRIPKWAEIWNKEIGA